MNIWQEKFIVTNKTSVLTMKGFIRVGNNPNTDLRRSQVRLFNHSKEAEIYASTRYSSDFEIKKVIVEINVLEE